MQSTNGLGISQSKHLPRAYVMLFTLGGVNLFNYMDRVLFSVMLEPIRLEMDFSDTQMGLLGGFAFSIFYGVVGLLAGRLADRQNRIRIIVFALVLWSAASAACGLARSFAQMFLARSMVGVGESGCIPSGHSLIGDYFPPHRRSLAVSIFTGIGTIGTPIGLIAGGQIVEAYGWRMAFVVFGVLGIMFAPIAFLLLREPPRGSFDRIATTPENWRDSVSMLLKRRTIKNLLVAIPLIFAIVGVATWIPAFFQRVHGVSAAEFGRSGGVSLGLGMLLGTFAGGFIANMLVSRNRLWEFWWPAITAFASVPLLGLLYASDDTTTAYFLLASAFFVAASGFGPAMACMQVVAEPAIRATLVAMMVFVTSLVSYGAGPAYVGFMSDLLAADPDLLVDDGSSLRSALMTTLVFPLISAVMFMLSARTAELDAVN